MNLYLKKAAPQDVDMLFEWANDDTVRKNAFHTEKILYENHVKWFSKTLADDAAYHYILYEDDMPIGQIRLNAANKAAVIDYSICAKKRGNGYGREIIRLMIRQMEADKITDVTKLIGQVKYENIASSRVFERCGFAKKELPEFIQYELEMERGLA